MDILSAVFGAAVTLFIQMVVLLLVKNRTALGKLFSGLLRGTIWVLIVLAKSVAVVLGIASIVVVTAQLGQNLSQEGLQKLATVSPVLAILVFLLVVGGGWIRRLAYALTAALITAAMISVELDQVPYWLQVVMSGSASMAVLVLFDIFANLSEQRNSLIGVWALWLGLMAYLQLAGVLG